VGKAEEITSYIVVRLLCLPSLTTFLSHASLCQPSDVSTCAACLACGLVMCGDRHSSCTR
jgi:hypothetical protein